MVHRILILFPRCKGMPSIITLSLLLTVKLIFTRQKLFSNFSKPEHAGQHHSGSLQLPVLSQMLRYAVNKVCIQFCYFETEPHATSESDFFLFTEL